MAKYGSRQPSYMELQPGYAPPLNTDAFSGHGPKPGVELLVDVPGLGAPVEKKEFYDFRPRMWLSHGDPVRWSKPTQAAPNVKSAGSR